MATFEPHDGEVQTDGLVFDDDEEVELEGREQEREPWCIWFDSQVPKGLTLAEYRERVRQVGMLNKLSDLGSYAEFNDFKFIPDDEAMVCGAKRNRDAFRFNLRFFRKSSTPFWEDQPTTAVIYTVRMPESLAPIDYQLFWKALTRSLLTGRLFSSEDLVDEDKGERRRPFNASAIVGVVVHYGRNKGHGTVEIWSTGTGVGAGEVPGVLAQIIPKEKYGYEVTVRSRDAAVNDNSSTRLQAGGTINPGKGKRPPPAFEKADVTRQAFQPYDDPKEAPRRTFQKQAKGRLAGFGSSKPKIEIVKTEQRR